MNIDSLNKKVKGLENETASLKGKIDLLEEQFLESQKSIDEIKELAIVNKKTIELLILIQKATKELIQSSFESIVTEALRFIHQSNDYKFELDFGKRGNIPELNFNIKTPDMQETHDILQTRGGGTTDIVGLALRLVLLEVSKTPGFLFLDEPSKHLDNEDTVTKMIEFIMETQKNTGRQIFLITHKDEIVESTDKPIIIK